MSELREKLNKTTIALIKSGDSMVGRTLSYHLEAFIDNTRDCLSTLEAITSSMQAEIARLAAGLNTCNQQIAELQQQINQQQYHISQQQVASAVVGAAASPSDPQAQFVKQLLDVTELAASLKTQLAGLENGLAR